MEVEIAEAEAKLINDIKELLTEHGYNVFENTLYDIKTLKPSINIMVETDDGLRVAHTIQISTSGK